MALQPLATAADLATRLKVPAWTGDDLAQVEAFLEDASEDLRNVTGQPLNRMTSTVTLHPIQRTVILPAVPVISIESVAAAGGEVAYGREDRTLFLQSGVGSVEVTYTHGYDPIPGELVKWTCVLAASYLSTRRGTLGMTAGAAARDEQIDDYRLSVRQSASADAGLILPERVASRLRAMYGAAGMEVVNHR